MSEYGDGDREVLVVGVCRCTVEFTAEAAVVVVGDLCMAVGICCDCELVKAVNWWDGTG